ncbi:MAG: hydroxyisourate hydrolase [Oscillochloridaceae bacterium umkhey_bin13]
MSTGRLTTHVLDLSAGRPAAGMYVVLVRLEASELFLTERQTNADGRVDPPLLVGEQLVAGRYELRFAVAAYFAVCGLSLPEPPFLDIVPIRFGIADPSAHYHVPLLVSPWAYSTYRGS